MTLGTLRLSDADVREFAEASRDVNPLHVDSEYARLTPCGHPVAHGALVVLTALRTIPAARLRSLACLDVDFLAPVHPGQPYTAEVLSAPGEVPGAAADSRLRIRVRSLGATAAMIRLTCSAGQTGPRFAPVPPAAGDRRASAPHIAGTAPTPRVWDFAGLARARPWRSTYAPEPWNLRILADRLGASNVPGALLLWLARSSWVAGTLAPGRDGLLAGLRLTPRTGVAARRDTSIEVAAADHRTGSILIRASFAGPEGAADVTLRTFLRAPVPAPTRAAVRAELPASCKLDGRQILVCGGSRGFGAALAGAFASQGATVWVLYRQSSALAKGLRTEFGSDRIRLIHCDAADPDLLAGVMGRLSAEGVVLDGLALTATPPLRTLPEDPDAISAVLSFVQQSMELALRPLTAALPLVRRKTGWVLAVSSAAVADPPAGWGHYAAAKAALEAYTAHCARRFGVRAVLLRAPKMHTSLVNGPTGKVGSVPAERVAATVVRWVLTGQDEALTGPDDDGITVLGASS